MLILQMFFGNSLGFFWKMCFCKAQDYFHVHNIVVCKHLGLCISLYPQSVSAQVCEYFSDALSCLFKHSERH